MQVEALSLSSRTGMVALESSLIPQVIQLGKPFANVGAIMSSGEFKVLKSSECLFLTSPAEH